MSHSWPLAVTLWVVGLWSIVAARYPDPLWERLTLNWPVPWSRLTVGTRRGLRVGLWVLAVAALLVGCGAVPR